MVTSEATEVIGKAVLYRDHRQRPPVLAPADAGIPHDLRAAPRWVLWALVWRGTRWTKVPLTAAGGSASSTDPATWTDFDAALAAYQQTPDWYAGLGFVLGDGWCGVDLDDVRHPDDGMRGWAADLLDALPTYAERSPSDTGVKLFGRGRWAGRWHKRPHPGGGDIEVYDTGRFFTVTGRGVNERPVADIGDKLTAALGAGPPRPTGVTTPKPRSDPGDADLFRRMEAAANGEKFRKLWAGDDAGYASPSEAEQALCNILAWWTGNSGGRVRAVPHTRPPLFRVEDLDAWLAGRYGR